MDSLARLMPGTMADTSRVQILCLMAEEASNFDPDSALALSYQASTLARQIKYVEGTSWALGVMANTFMQIGNYPRALELDIEKLKLEEHRNLPRSLAIVSMNMGIVYALQEDYPQALAHYKTADSLIRLHHISDLAYNIALNTGDTYDRLNRPDSAFPYFSRSLKLAREAGDIDLVGTSLTGLGHTYRKQHAYELAKSVYREAIGNLTVARDEVILGEALVGLARTFQAVGASDSARQVARYALEVAAPGFPAIQLDAAQLLQQLYRDAGKNDSAFIYVDKVKSLNDLINSKSNIRKAQIISSNENLRQLELAAEREIERKERHEQLQLLLIAIFIPLFFLITLFLSRVALSDRFIRLMGILSLLLFFEFITLLIHPKVAEVTHHTPIYELLSMVALAAIIIPIHHRIEHWLIEKLIRRHEQHLLWVRTKRQNTKKPPLPAVRKTKG
jgi:tetratricopeptide (TPR) repeat protein